jgi:hypothetical protein
MSFELAHPELARLPPGRTMDDRSLAEPFGVRGCVGQRLKGTRPVAP